MVGGDLFVAAAVDTEGFAKREVDIEADPARFVAFAEPALESLFPARDIRVLLPERHGGIAGITGDGSIVFIYHRDIGWHGHFSPKIGGTGTAAGDPEQMRG